MSFGRRVHIKTDEEVELLRESSLLVGKTLAAVADRIKPGVTTLELDLSLIHISEPTRPY